MICAFNSATQRFEDHRFGHHRMTVSLRPSTEKDLGFVFSLAQNGARHGHFDPKINTDKAAFREYLNASINHKADPRGHPTSVLVAYKDDIRIGATVVTTAIGTPDVGVELAMIALKNEFREKGYGSIMLDAVLNEYLHHVSVYARCLPASDRLHQMLRRRDFDEVGILGQSIILRHGCVDPGR